MTLRAETRMAALVLPVGVSLIALVVILLFLAAAPDAIVMQWSGGGASRMAPPAELLLMPGIAIALSILIWLVLPTGSRRDARFGFVIANCVVTFLNAAAVALLVSQLSAPRLEVPPYGALVAGLIPVALVGVGTFMLTKRRLG